MPESRASYRDVLAVAEFRWLWLAQALSVVGDQLARVALTILVFDRTASAGLAALTYALTYVPDLVGGAALAGFADRYSRRTVMVVTDLARAVLVATMAVPAIPLAAQIGLLVMVQLLAAPFSAARQAVLPDLLPGDRLTLGIGIVSMTYQAGLVLAFGAGAALVSMLGVSGTLLIDAATFVVSAVIIGCAVRPHHPHRADGGEPTGEPRPRQWQTIAAGWRLAASNARLRWLLAIACCSGFYVVPEGLAVPFAADAGASGAAVGWLLAANPAGSVIGMILLRFFSPERRLALMGPLAVASSLVLLPTMWAPDLATVVTLWAISGLCSAHDMTTQATYVACAPAHRRGQAIGVAIAALRSAQGLAIIAAGFLAQLLSPATIVTLAAGLGTLAALAATMGWSRAASPPTTSSQDEADGIHSQP